MPIVGWELGQPFGRRPLGRMQRMQQLVLWRVEDGEGSCCCYCWDVVAVVLCIEKSDDRRRERLKPRIATDDFHQER